MRRVAHAVPGTMTIQLQAFFFQVQFQHAEGVPVVTVNLPDGHTSTLFSFCRNQGWPELRFPEKKKEICVLQLAGLLQFKIVPRHPIIGQDRKFANWGYQAGLFFTYLCHQVVQSIGLDASAAAAAAAAAAVAAAVAAPAAAAAAVAAPGGGSGARQSSKRQRVSFGGNATQ